MGRCKYLGFRVIVITCVEKLPLALKFETQFQAQRFMDVVC